MADVAGERLGQARPQKNGATIRFLGARRTVASGSLATDRK
jgi:hypothetical protein